jgi:adenylate cyclase class 2
MSIEVEQKFRVFERSDLERRLAALGGKHRATVDQADCYYAHPTRDFARSDEACRLRRVGERNYITYKGPKLDATTKTRREIEISFADGNQAAADAASLLEALGFTGVAEVCKRRTHFTLPWQNREIDVSLDHIAELGDFVELEIVAEPSDVGQARDCIASLAKELGLKDSLRSSYLELLLARREHDSTHEKPGPPAM